MRDPHQIEPRVRLSPSVFASPPVIDGFSLAFCKCSPFYFVVSVFLVLPFYSIHRPYASYFVSNSTGCGFFSSRKSQQNEKKEEKRREREREDREDRYSIQGESSGEELDSRIFFASVTRRPGSGPSNQSTGPQSNSRRFTEIMDGRKQLDPRQRTPNKYRSDEIEDTQRNRDEERGNGEREGDSMVRWPDAKK